MYYTATESGYDVFYDFSGEHYHVGFIRIENKPRVFMYSDTLFHTSCDVLHKRSLSQLKDAISHFYSSRNSIEIIEEKWR